MLLGKNTNRNSRFKAVMKTGTNRSYIDDCQPLSIIIYHLLTMNLLVITSYHYLLISIKSFSNRQGTASSKKAHGARLYKGSGSKFGTESTQTSIVCSIASWVGCCAVALTTVYW